MPKGDGEKYGIETGLTRGQFICMLFDRQPEARLPDEKLVEMLRLEFPNCDSKYEYYIRMYRNKYNRGEWSCQSEAPDIPVIRYTENGEPYARRGGPAPRLPWEEKVTRGETDAEEEEAS